MNRPRLLLLGALVAMLSSLLTAGVWAGQPRQNPPASDPRSPLNAAPLTYGAYWVTETVDNGTHVGEFIDLDVDWSTGYAHIAYYDAYHGDLKYAEQTASGWDIQVLDAGGVGANDVGRFASLKLDGWVRPHIAYYDATDKNLKYIYRDTIGWHGPYTVFSAGDVGQYTDIAINPTNNKPYISYSDLTNNWGCYAFMEGDTWDHVCYTDTPWLAYMTYSSIENQPLGWPLANLRPVVASFLNHSFGGVGYWYDTGIGMPPPDYCEVEHPGFPGAFVSMELDNRSQPVLAYYGGDTPCLRYAYNNSSPLAPCVYTVESADCEGGNVGLYTSLVMWLGSTPYISYYDAANTRLKFAYKIGATWHHDVVDNAGDVGQYSSLAMDAYGHARIAYYDASNGHLKFARQVIGFRAFLPILRK